MKLYFLKYSKGNSKVGIIRIKTEAMWKTFSRKIIKRLVQKSA